MPPISVPTFAMMHVRAYERAFRPVVDLHAKPDWVVAHGSRSLHCVGAPAEACLDAVTDRHHCGVPTHAAHHQRDLALTAAERDVETSTLRSLPPKTCRWRGCSRVGRQGCERAGFRCPGR